MIVGLFKCVAAEQTCVQFQKHLLPAESTSCSNGEFHCIFIYSVIKKQNKNNNKKTPNAYIWNRAE